MHHHNYHRISGIFIIFISIMMTFSAYGSDILSGIVRNEEGKPLPSAIITAIFPDGEKMSASSDPNGSFRLVVPDNADTLLIRFSKLGYDPDTIRISRPKEKLEITLRHTSRILKEVTVKAPSVRVKGDTISYNLGDFAGKGDVTLEDALKKVPGIDIEKNGGIKYNGKSISNFYINGMEMLGGKYNLATTSLPHSYVSAVEILNNHQSIKIDKKVFNDNVAINIRLKSKAMFKPVGKYDLSAGFGDKFLGEASGAGMLFTDNFQTILTMKGGNRREFATRDNIEHYYDSRSSQRNPAKEILGTLTASQPPLSRDRWIDPADFSTTLNFIKKLSDDATIKTSAGYNYTHTNYDYSETASYYNGETDMTVNQVMQPEESSHKPSFSLEYKLNSDTRYIRNSLSAEASVNTYALPLFSNGILISQNQKMKSFDISDNFNINWKRGKVRWNFHSALGFNGNPTGLISADEPAGDKSMLQSGRSYSFVYSGGLSAYFEKRSSRFTLPFDISFNHLDIHTDLDNRGFGDDATFNFSNFIRGMETVFSFSPSYEFHTPYNRLVIRMTVPVDLRMLDWDAMGPASVNKTVIKTTPSFYLNYEASVKSTFRINAGVDNCYGDILDILCNPVMTDYMSMSFKSGILSHRKSFSSTLTYYFKSPVNLWNINAGINYSKSRNNIISSQTVTSGLIVSGTAASPDNTDNLGISAGVSKKFRDINTTISLNATSSWSRNAIEHNGDLTRYHGNTIAVVPRLFSNPFRWAELDYSLNYSRQKTRFNGTDRSYSSLTNDISLRFFPAGSWEFTLHSDITRKKISSDLYKTMSLFDINGIYKFKSFRLGAHIRNILNCRDYSYTMFNALDSYSYSYRLRGREFIISFTFIK